MTWTSHGHHMPGTPPGLAPPKYVMACGGAKICQQCRADTEEEIRLNNQVASEDPMGYAIKLVSDLVNDQARGIGKLHEQPYDVKLLEFHEQDGSWRALLGTFPNDKQRFEVTYKKNDLQVELTAWSLVALYNLDIINC